MSAKIMSSYQKQLQSMFHLKETPLLLVSVQEVDLASKLKEPPGKKRAPSSKRTIESSSEQASFSVVLKNHQEYNVVVPMDFAQEMGLAEKPSSVIRDSKGRKWTVNILVDGRSTVRLGAGWAKCVKDNKLELGDTISFKHIPNTGNVINIEIISKAGDGDGAAGKRNKRENSC